jgi:outer membrane protein
MTPRPVLLLALAPALAAAQAAPATPPAAAPAAPARRVITLEEAVASARANEPQLRQAEANARGAEARADQQRSGLLPQIGVNGGYERSGTDRRVPVLGGAAGETTAVLDSSTWSAGVVADQTLFDAGTLYRWRSARSSADALRSAAETTRLDVVSTVQAQYFAARARRDLVRVARETVQNDEAHLRQVQAFVDVGTQPPIALAQVRADLASARLALIRAENDYSSSRALLAQAMGLREWQTDFDVADETLPPVAGEDGSLEPLLAEALEARPELATIAAQERASEQSRSAARAGWLPALGARATYNQSGPSLDETNGSWSAGVSLTWNIFNGGFTSASVREADATLESLRAQEVGLRTSIRVALEQAFLAVRAAQGAVVAASEAESAAREQLRLAEGRFEAGVGSIIELGDAQVAATLAAAQRVRAEFDLSAARAALVRAVGRK